MTRLAGRYRRWCWNNVQTHLVSHCMFSATATSCSNRDMLCFHHLKIWLQNLYCFKNMRVIQFYWSVHFSHSVLSDSLWPHGLQHARLPCLSPTPGALLKLMSLESVIPSNHFILCCPILLPSILPSIRVFSNESVLRIRWPKYWSFSFNIRPSSEYAGLIYFVIDWFDLLAVQGTLKSILQHHSWKASVLQCSAFFIV